MFESILNYKNLNYFKKGVLLYEKVIFLEDQSKLQNANGLSCKMCNTRTVSITNTSK